MQALKELEVERLDALQVALRDAATQGDVTTAGEIVRVVAASSDCADKRHLEGSHREPSCWRPGDRAWLGL